MKYLIMLSLFSLFACKTTKSKAFAEKQTLTVFSKGACLGKCPVFDFTVYSDGTYLYQGIKNIKTKGSKSDKLSDVQFNELKKLLSNTENLSYNFQKKRDKAVIALTHKGKITKFHLPNSTKELSEVSNWFDSFISKMN